MSEKIRVSFGSEAAARQGGLNAEPRDHVATAALLVDEVV
jgi:hypothetical protein